MTFGGQVGDFRLLLKNTIPGNLMANHKIRLIIVMDDNSSLTESEEMYLVSIAMLLENGAADPVPVSLLANEMNITAISANQMVRKLEECGLVRYSPYKGVSLTEEGEKAALRVLRHRRLWEVFLVERLRFSPNESERQACRVEHIFPDEAVERLAEYLGQPTKSPQGKAIPAAEDARLENDLSLRQINAGQEGKVSQIDASPATRAFLAHQGLSAGEPLKVLATAQDGDILVSVGGKTVNLAAELAQSIRVQLFHLPQNPTPTTSRADRR
jgi:DtxR family transcriptional regulator, Mn-dependent transcriptional regulator